MLLVIRNSLIETDESNKEVLSYITGNLEIYQAGSG